MNRIAIIIFHACVLAYLGTASAGSTFGMQEQTMTKPTDSMSNSNDLVDTENKRWVWGCPPEETFSGYENCTPRWYIAEIRTQPNKDEKPIQPPVTVEPPQKPGKPIQPPVAVDPPQKPGKPIQPPVAVDPPQKPEKPIQPPVTVDPPQKPEKPSQPPVTVDPPQKPQKPIQPPVTVDAPQKPGKPESLEKVPFSLLDDRLFKNADDHAAVKNLYYTLFNKEKDDSGRRKTDSDSESGYSPDDIDNPVINTADRFSDLNPDEDCENVKVIKTTVINNCTGETTQTIEYIGIACETFPDYSETDLITIQCGGGTTNTLITTVNYEFLNGNCCVCSCGEITRKDCCAGGNCCEVCGFEPVCPTLSEDDCGCIPCGETHDECCEICYDNFFDGASQCPLPSGDGGGSLESINFYIGLNEAKTANQSAIRLKSKEINNNIYSPEALDWSSIKNLKIERDADGNIIKAETFNNLVLFNYLQEGGYTMSIYNKMNIQGQNDKYLPVALWLIENPGSEGLFERIRITKLIANEKSISYEYSYNATENAWMLATNNNSTIEKSLTKIDSARKVKTIFRTIEDGSGKIHAQQLETYLILANSDDVLIEKVEDPFGKALKTSYNYNALMDNTRSKCRNQNIASIIYPDGSWTKFEYDALGRTIKELYPWKDVSFDEASLDNCSVTKYSYDSLPGSGDNLSTIGRQKPRLIEYWAEGKLIGAEYHTYIRKGDILHHHIEKSIGSNASYGHPLNRKSISSTYISGFLKGKKQYELKEDGTTRTYNYLIRQQNNLASTLPQAYISAMSITNGTVENPLGLPYETTMEKYVYDQNGAAVEYQTYIYTGAKNYERATTEYFRYDEWGNLKEHTLPNGIVKVKNWQNNHLLYEYDGISTASIYGYDEADKLAYSRSFYINADGDKVEIDTVERFSEFSPLEKNISLQVSGNKISGNRTYEYDIMGNISKESFDNKTYRHYDYEYSNLTKSSLSPGLDTVQEQYYVDGTLKETKFNNSASLIHEHGVTETGLLWNKTTSFNSSGTLINSQSTYQNYLGEIVRKINTSPQGSDTTTILYNFHGQKTKEENSQFFSRIYEYDKLGQQSKQTISIKPLSNTYSTVFNKEYTRNEENSWFLTEKSSAYSNELSNTKVQSVRLNNFNGEVIAESIVETKGEKNVNYLKLRDIKGLKVPTAEIDDKYKDERNKSFLLNDKYSSKNFSLQRNWGERPSEYPGDNSSNTRTPTPRQRYFCDCNCEKAEDKKDYKYLGLYKHYGVVRDPSEYISLLDDLSYFQTLLDILDFNKDVITATNVVLYLAQYATTDQIPDYSSYTDAQREAIKKALYKINTMFLSTKPYYVSLKFSWDNCEPCRTWYGKKSLQWVNHEKFKLCSGLEGQDGTALGDLYGPQPSSGPFPWGMFYKCRKAFMQEMGIPDDYQW
jgi:YD repeat-containing protein